MKQITHMHLEIIGGGCDFEAHYCPTPPEIARMWRQGLMIGYICPHQRAQMIE